MFRWLRAVGRGLTVGGVSTLSGHGLLRGAIETKTTRSLSFQALDQSGHPGCGFDVSGLIASCLIGHQTEGKALDGGSDERRGELVGVDPVLIEERGECLQLHPT